MLETKSDITATKCVHARLRHVCMPKGMEIHDIFLKDQYYHMNISFKFHKDPVYWLRRYLQNNYNVCLTFLRMLTTKRARTGLFLVCARVGMDLCETFFIWPLLSYGLKFQIL